MLERMFQHDNAFWRFMGKVGDLMILNFLLFLCMLPIVTVGAGICAAYYVLFKIVEQENSGTLRSFFKSFRQNFMQATVITLILLLFGAAVFADLWFLMPRLGNPAAGSVKYLLAAGGGFLLILYLIVCLYAFPLQARFENPVRITLLNALFFGIRNLPRTVLMIAADGILTAVFIKSFYAAPRLAVLPFLLGLPCILYLNTLILRKLLRLEPGKGVRIPEQKEETEETV